MIRCVSFVQAADEETAISEVVNALEWPGCLLDEEYTAAECSCSDVLDWMNKRNQFCIDCKLERIGDANG